MTIREIRAAQAKANEYGDEADVVLDCGSLLMFVTGEGDQIHLDSSLKVVTLDSGEEDWEANSAIEVESFANLGIMIDGEVYQVGALPLRPTVRGV